MAKQTKRRPASPRSPSPAPAERSEPASRCARNGATPWGEKIRDLLPEGLGPLGRAGLAALLAALVLAPVWGGVPSGALYGHDVALNVLRALVLLSGLCFVLAAGPSPATGGEGLTGGAYFALWGVFGMTLLSLLWYSRLLTSDVLLFAMLPATLDWLCYALVFTLALALSRDRKALALIVGALLAGAAWVAVTGVLEYGGQVQMGNPAWRVKATFFTENFTAGFLGLCLPVASARLLTVRSPIGVVVTGTVAALTAGVLVATGSRVGIAAAGAGLGIAFVLALLARRRFSWVRIGGLLVVILLLAWGFHRPLLTRVSGQAGDQAHSGAFRAWTWQGTWRMARANPVLGAGPGTFEFRYPPHALVAKTNLAHSSYAQLAAEQGLPALLMAVTALAAVLLGGLRRLPHRGDVGEDAADPLLLCGLLGGLVTGSIRGVFDSEWSVLGTALPFWAVAGLCLTPRPPSPAQGRGRGVRGAGGAGLVAALVLTTVLFVNAVTLQGALAIRREDPQDAAARARAAARAWPPDPNALVLHGRFLGGERALALYEQAARIEPSGRRHYQLARLYEHQGRLEDAVRAFARAARADPTSLQTLRALAEAQERRGEREAALAAWRRLAAVHEGPVGRIRAIPELPETYPAFAYAALAEDAAARGDEATAALLYEKAAAVVEDYADTIPTYQAMELAMAQQTGADLAARRQELWTLYEKVMDARIARAGDGAAARTLRRRRDEIRARIEAFPTMDNGAEGA